MIQHIPSFSLGFIAGLGTGFFAREIAESGKGVMRPLTKEVVKTGIAFYDKACKSLANLFESIEDIVAEAKSEAQAEAREATVEPVVTAEKVPVVH